MIETCTSVKGGFGPLVGMTVTTVTHQAPVASLGRVTPGAATEGVTPLFFPEKPGDLFLLIAVTIAIAFIAFTRASPLPGCHPTLFYLSDLVSPLFFVNLPTHFFPSGVTPWVSPGVPPSDATVKHVVQ